MRFLALASLFVLTACGGTSRNVPAPPAPAAAAQPPTAVTTPPAPTDPYADELNLGFEELADARPARWSNGVGGFGGGGATGYERTIDRDAHGGATSLRFRANGSGNFASAAVTTDAIPLRGKRVRLHGWVKTEGVAAPGWAGVWLRVDGGAEQAFDNMSDRGLTGTEGWREAVVHVDVPADAVTLVLGPLLVGAGTAWFDDLRLEVVDIPPAKPITITGVVVDPAGKPAPGATVTLMDVRANISAVVAADSGGRFRLSTTTGAWGVSAHHPSGTGAFFDPREFVSDTDDVRLALTDGGVQVRGRVIAAGPLPADFRIKVYPVSDHQTDGFAVPVRADGSFEVRLPRADKYRASVQGTAAVGTGEANRKGDAVDLELRITVLAPPPAEVNAWVSANAIPLVSAEAGHGFSDMKRIGAMIGKARIVGLGEATHGTREFLQLKHRFLEYLVTQHGFTVFAIEANLPECRAINTYVLTGKGDPRAALDGIYFWTWNTEEVLAMIEWMRSWNADPKHQKKLHFVGVDMQTTTVAVANVVAFLKRVAPATADQWTAPLALLAKDSADEDFTAASASEQASVQDALATLQKRFESSRGAWSKQAGTAAFLDAREDLRVIAQAVTMFRSSRHFEARDIAMADNVDAILARYPRGTRIAFWAHNGHVANGLGTLKNVGQHLRERHGKDYVIFGFAFGEGSFQARDWTKGQGEAVIEHTLGPPPAWDVSAPFRATGKPIVVVDLRKAPRGAVADWLAAPHPMRETGAVFTTEKNMSDPVELSRRYDAIIYVDRTTRARPNPGGVRPKRN